MARIPEKAVNAHIPEGVFDALDALIADMPPYSKKMIVGVLDADGEPARTVTFHLAGDQESSQEKP